MFCFGFILLTYVLSRRHIEREQVEELKTKALKARTDAELDSVSGGTTTSSAGPSQPTVSSPGIGRYFSRMTAEQIQSKRHLEGEARQLVTAFALSVGLYPTDIIAAYSPDSELYKAIQILGRHGVSIGSETTVRRDLKAVEPILVDFIKDDLRGCTGSLVTDGASLRDNKAIAILFSTHQNVSKKPVLLSVIFPEKSDDAGCPAFYDASKAAADIVQTCSVFEISIPDQVTCIMGDNVTFNDALASELKLPRARCLAHALNLIVKNSISSIVLTRPLIQVASSVIHAGGTSKRVAELRSEAFKLDPNKMMFYPNRFGSAVVAAKYRLHRFQDVKRWYLTSNSAPVLNLDDSESDDDDNEGSGYGKWNLCSEAYALKRAELVLAVVQEMFGKIPDLITETSADKLTVIGSDLLDRLELLRDSFDILKAEVQALSLISTARSKLSVPLTPAEFNEAKAVLKIEVAHAALAACKSFDKHVKPMMDHLLRHRFMFDPRNPPPMKEPAALTPSFFGIPVDKWNPALVSEYRMYQRNWTPTMTETDGDIATFWMTKRSVWESLSAVALWWLETPTSSVSAERVFAVMRLTLQSTRLSLTNGSIARELVYKMNSDSLERAMQQKLQQLLSFGTSS